MKAGKSNYEVGTKIKITRVTDAEDQHLIGLTGTLTHPFGCYPASYLGVRLEPTEQCKKTLNPSPLGSYMCNLEKRDRFEVIE